MLLEKVGTLDPIGKAKYIWLVMNWVGIEELKCPMIPGQLQQHRQSVAKMEAKILPIQMQYPAYNWIKMIFKMVSENSQLPYLIIHTWDAIAVPFNRSRISVSSYRAISLLRDILAKFWNLVWRGDIAFHIYWWVVIPPPAP